MFYDRSFSLFFFIFLLQTVEEPLKCPIFHYRLRNFTERFLTSALCKKLLPHASIRTIKRKLRNFTEFCQSRLFPYQATYGSYGQRQLFVPEEIQHLLQQIPRKYSPELRQLLDYIANNDVRAIIELRRNSVS